ncbi:hypothetical protein ACS0TY_014108 [Phlomoides rotata]
MFLRDAFILDFTSEEKNVVLSYNPCQFPTLGFVVERFWEIQSHEPEEFWTINCTHNSEEGTTIFNWMRGHLFDYTCATIIYNVYPGIHCNSAISHLLRKGSNPKAQDQVKDDMGQSNLKAPDDPIKITPNKDQAAVKAKLDNAHIYSYMDELLHHTFVVLSIGIVIIMLNKGGCRNISDLVGVSDEVCRDQLRMDRATFHKLWFMLESIGGLKSFRRVTVCKKVVMFLAILAHHTKNRCVKFQFKRSDQTVSTQFHAVLHCVLKMHSLFLIKPQPVAEDSMDPRMDQHGNPLGQDGNRVKNCLTDVVNDEWKAENGFIDGFQRELEKGMRKLLPGTDIVSNPHINSKIHVWKKEYGVLSDLLSKSGI